MSDRPPCPVREPTPTLDALLAKYQPGRARFYQVPDGSLGERDFALEMYERKFDDQHAVPIAQADLDAVSPIDFANALSYPTRYNRWCNDYNGGFNAGASPNEAPATMAQLAAKADPPIIPASVVAEPVKPAPQVFAPFPAPIVRAPVVTPLPKSKPSLWSRFWDRANRSIFS